MHLDLPQPQWNLIGYGVNQSGGRWQRFQVHGIEVWMYHTTDTATGIKYDLMRRSDGVAFYRETPGSSCALIRSAACSQPVR